MKALFTAISFLFLMNTVAAQQVVYEVRYAHHPLDVKNYDTEKLRKEFRIETVFTPDKINMVYTMYDRFIVGGAMPVEKDLKLETIDPLKAPNFLYRREIGIINVGGPGIVKVGEIEYELGFKEALYVGSGTHEIVFRSNNKDAPSKFYFNSAPAHKACPVKKITKKDAKTIQAGSPGESNARTIYQLIVAETVEVCQLQMGMTELLPGSVWNTMPPHVHDRRMEAYFYFELPENQAVAHFMGKPDETRHLWLGNEQAVIAPPWSIHAGAGTTNYTFIWGMAGENIDYGDMERVSTADLKGEKVKPVSVQKTTPGGPKPFIKQSEIPWEPAGENVRRQIMGWNEQSMMVKVEFLKAGAVGTVHSHPHLQNSVVAAGKFEVTIGEQKTVLEAGDGYFVDPNVPHGVICLEPGTLVDAFTPFRADFVPKETELPKPDDEPNVR